MKTIELDADAYAALSREKAPDQTFSELIKTRFRSHVTAAELRKAAIEANVSMETLDAIDEVSGHTAKGSGPAGHSLDWLIGTWSEEEEREFLRAIEDFEQVDESFWT